MWIWQSRHLFSAVFSNLDKNVNVERNILDISKKCPKYLNFHEKKNCFTFVNQNYDFWRENSNIFFLDLRNFSAKIRSQKSLTVFCDWKKPNEKKTKCIHLNLMTYEVKLSNWVGDIQMPEITQKLVSEAGDDAQKKDNEIIHFHSVCLPFSSSVSSQWWSWWDQRVLPKLIQDAALDPRHCPSCRF